MLLNNLFVLVFLTFLYSLDTAQSRVIKITDIPITSEELTLKFVLNNDTSSHSMGKLFVLVKDQEEPTIDRSVPEPNSSFVPNFENRVSITNGKKCAKGYKMNPFGRCKPIKTFLSK